MSNQSLTFEKAFERLEKILEELNSGHPTLEESLKLYEEATGLIAFSEKTLNSAEKKIEALVKTRSGELSSTLEGKPETEPLV
jgi:exodeoxyribonuclease VII small subunit